MNRTTAKAKRTKEVKPETRTLTARWVIDPVIQVPTPTSIKECPRCGKTHLKLRVRKFKKPVKVADRLADSWAACPMTHEPIILFTYFIRAATVEKEVMDQLADQLASEIDKEILADITSYVTGFQKKNPAGNVVTSTTASSDEQPPRQMITLGYAGGESETWTYSDPFGSAVSLAAGPPKKGKGKKGKKGKALVYDPNAPGRIVPGSQEEHDAQVARVRAQEKAAKKQRKPR